MIRIVRGVAPEVLTHAGAAACQAMCERVEKDGDLHPLKFDGRIFGDTSVYRALHSMQHGKCCYCECLVDRGTIDHYRPKGSVAQSSGTRVSTRGYYWLAYTWENLLLACEACNMRFKRDFFPLEVPERRVLHHKDAARLAQEAPLLLDPTLDEPEVHISFRAYTPVARTRRGRATIELLRLDSSFLDNQREQIYWLIDKLLTILEASRTGITALPESLKRAMCEQLVRFSAVTHAYAGMIQNMLQRRLGPEVEFPLAHDRLMTWAAGPAPETEPRRQE